MFLTVCAFFSTPEMPPSCAAAGRTPIVSAHDHGYSYR